MYRVIGGVGTELDMYNEEPLLVHGVGTNSQSID